MYMGVIMIGIGSYSIFSEFYDTSTFLKKKVLVKCEESEKSEYFKMKFAVGIFSITIGILLILNYLS